MSPHHVGRPCGKDGGRLYGTLLSNASGKLSADRQCYLSRETHTFGYYYSLSGKLDDSAIIEIHKKEIVSTILGSLKDNTSMKEYKQAGYNFRYVMKSSTTGEVLIDKTFTKKNIISL